jgi:hypothetical protein
VTFSSAPFFVANSSVVDAIANTAAAEEEFDHCGFTFRVRVAAPTQRSTRPLSISKVRTHPHPA